MEGEDLTQGLIVVQGQDHQQILLQDENASHFAVGDGHGHVGVATGIGENEQVILNTEGGEVFVFDEESGQYQRYFYVQNDENGFDPNTEEDTSSELVEPTIEINEGFEGVDQNSSAHQFNIVPNSNNTDDLQQQEKEHQETETFMVVPPKGEKQKQLVLSQSSSLEPGTLIQCNKCWETFLADEFEDHFKEAHENNSSVDHESEIVIPQDPGFKNCAICGLPSRNKKEYLVHFKSAHAGYKLGCPKCPQTYHSPELLHVHYKHFHLRETPIIPSQQGGPKRAHVMLRCEYCDDIVEDLPQHLISVHELDEPTALAVTQDRPLQVILDASNQSVQQVASGQSYSLIHDQATISPASRGPMKKYQPPTRLYCNICGKDFATQREFTNHRRRKDFCKPIHQPQPIRDEPKTIRRIGIIRKVMQK